VVHRPIPERQDRKALWEYTPDELADLEADQQGALLKADAALGLPVLQPLSFKRSVRHGGGPQAFTLLYDTETGAYVLALVVHGRHRSSTAAAQNMQTESGEVIKHFQPKVGENLRFVSFPDKPYEPPKRTSVLMFSLKYGQDYHEQRFLEPALKRLRVTQAASVEPADASQPAATGEEKHHNLAATATADTEEHQAGKKVSRKPNALTGSAQIVCWWSAKDGPRFYAHVPLPIPVPTRSTIPSTVLGIHEHRYGYSYAVLSLDGEVRAIGDLEINPDVLPREDDTKYNPNHAPEVAIAIVRLAEKFRSYIGIEDKSYLREAGLSRVQNREVFSRPSKRIFKIVAYKAPLNEALPLMPPRLIGDISAGRDCSQCRSRMQQGYKGVRRIVYVECPQCQAHQPLGTDDEVVQECQTCSMTWRAREAFVEYEFVCEKCGVLPMPARYNTAIVVGQQTLVQLVNHAAWLKGKRK
jgi:hypothetical protein